MSRSEYVIVGPPTAGSRLNPNVTSCPPLTNVFWLKSKMLMSTEVPFVVPIGLQ